MSDLTIEQIAEAIQGNKELETAVVTKALQTETGKSVLNNHLATSKDSIVKETATDATRRAYESIDNALKQAGYEKPEGVKSSEYLLQVLGKEKEEKANLSKKAEDQESVKKYAETLKTQFGEKETEYKTTIEKLQKELQNVQVSASVKALRWDFDDNIDSDLLAQYKNATESQLVNNAKIIDGKVVYHDENGNPYLNDLRDYATAEEILKTKYQKYLKQAPKAGGGAGKEKPLSKVSGTGALVGDGLEKSVTRVQLYDAFMVAAKRQALTGAKKDEAWEATKKQYGFDSMPEQ